MLMSHLGVHFVRPRPFQVAAAAESISFGEAVNDVTVSRVKFE